MVDGYPENGPGELGDLATLLEWHRSDPPDDYEMHRNNVVYTWQFNRNPFIDQPDLVEYIWGDNVGDVWDQSLSVSDFDTTEIKVVPNPTSNRIYISGIQNKTKIDVLSIEGRLVKTFNLQSDSYLDLELPNGIYLLNLYSNQRQVVKKIIIN